MRESGAFLDNGRLGNLDQLPQQEQNIWQNVSLKNVLEGTEGLTRD